MIKLGTQYQSSAIGTTDLFDQAEEVYSAYESVLALGIEVNELGTVIDNMKFAQDCISKNGVQWYIDNCDPEGALAESLGCACEALSTVKVQAGMEGLLKDAWDKISEWVKRFIDWIKGLFKNDASAKVVAAADQQTQQNMNDAKKKEAKAPREKVEKAKAKVKAAPVPRSVVSIKADYDRFKKFCGADEKKTKKGIFGFLSLVNLKKWLNTLFDKIRGLMGLCDDILGKFKSAKSKEEYAIAIREAKDWCAKSKADLLQITDKNDVENNTIEAEWADVTCEKAGIRSLEDCNKVAGLLTNNGVIYVGCQNLGKSCDTTVTEIKNKLGNSSGDDEEMQRLKFQAMEAVMYMMQIRAQMLAHAKKMPASLSIAAKDVSALPLKELTE